VQRSLHKLELFQVERTQIGNPKREVNVGEARAYFRTPRCGARPEKVAQCGIPTIPTKKINFNGRRLQPAADLAPGLVQEN
jgi:hypothetical protein